jgi:hypothetical protein
MKLKDLLLKEEEENVDEYMDDSILTILGEFVDLLDDDFLTEDVEDIIVDIVDKYIDLLEKLDIDNLSDEVADHLDYILDILDIDLDEVAKKKVIRKGKMVKRLPPKEGYKVVGNRYVRMKPTESKKRSRSAKRGARKARVKNASRQRNMKKSLRKRAGRGLK